MSTSTTDVVASRSSRNGSPTMPETISDQVVLSGAGLLSQSLELTRSNATALVDVLDEIVLGAFDVIEEWNTLSTDMARQLTAKPVEVARKAYTTGSATLRQALTTV